MIKNPNKEEVLYEEFDQDALEELSKMAFCYVAIEEGCNTDMPFNKTIPGDDYSIFSEKVWELFVKAVRDGMALQESLAT